MGASLTKQNLLQMDEEERARQRQEFLQQQALVFQEQAARLQEQAKHLLEETQKLRERNPQQKSPPQTDQSQLPSQSSDKPHKTVTFSLNEDESGSTDHAKQQNESLSDSPDLSQADEEAEKECHGGERDDSGVDVMTSQEQNIDVYFSKTTFVSADHGATNELAALRTSQSQNSLTQKNKLKLQLDLNEHADLSRLGSATSPNLTQEDTDAEFMTPTPRVSTPSYAKMRHIAQSPVAQLTQLPVTSDPYMSPFLADADMLRLLPPVFFVVSRMNLDVFFTIFFVNACLCCG